MNDVVFRQWISGLREDIIVIREKYGIPKEGFFIRESVDKLSKEKKAQAIDGLNKREIWDTESNGDIKRSKEINSDLRRLLTKYNLPPHLLLLLKEYLLSGPLKDPINDVENFPPIDIDFRAITRSDSILKMWDESGIPYVSVIIPSLAALKETQTAIKENWPIFERIWEVQGWHKEKKRHRPIKNKDIKDRLLELDAKIVKRKGEYKEIGIGRKIKEEFPDKPDQSFENIRMVKHRYKK